MSTIPCSPSANAAVLLLSAVACGGPHDELGNTRTPDAAEGSGGSAHEPDNAPTGAAGTDIATAATTAASAGPAASSAGMGGAASNATGSMGSSDTTGNAGATSSTSDGFGGNDTSTNAESTGGSGATSGETSVTTTGGGGNPTGPTPEIPPAAGACPEFVTGTQTILDLETDLFVGTPVSTPGPLLFTWHGTGSSGSTALNFQLPSSVRNSISELGGIIVAPNDDLRAREGSTANGVWYETSDLLYADHIVACAVENHNIDPRRVYVTGCSAGGLMAGAMAIKRSSYVAAAAPNSGGIISLLAPTLEDPSHIPAVMNLHGGAGDNVGINFGDTSASFADFITEAGGFAVDCDHSSGHCGAPGELTESAWQFMMNHPFGTSPSPYEVELPTTFPSYCRIW